MIASNNREKNKVTLIQSYRIDNPFQINVEEIVIPFSTEKLHRLNTWSKVMLDCIVEWNSTYIKWHIYNP